MNQNTINRVTTMRHSPKQSTLKVIKRYGNRKLYDTERSSYVVLPDIAKMIQNEEEVQIIDNETKEDITSSTLVQIICAKEKKTSCSAPLNVLKHIIKKGDGSFSSFLVGTDFFKSQIADKKTMKENSKGKKTKTGKARATESFKNETLSDRIMGVALSQSVSSLPENEKTILPTSSNGNLVRED